MNAPQNTYQAPMPGRVRMCLDDVRQEWVDKFPDRAARLALWGKFQNYLAHFADIEQKAIDSGWLDDDEEIIKYVWLGGSFISDKIAPRNLDVTVFLNGPALEKLKGKKGSGWVRNKAFARDSLSKDANFSGISPIRVDYYPVKSVFHLSELGNAERNYLLERGAWDEWWQRLRDSHTDAPTESSAATRRGYVEVIL
ncbi:hypothetical protein CAFEA_10980 [Corynebacterium afermentans subsp. afermentans]|uniref:Uncharacterized protein n=1 Tax=Corynebacterium afermentans TaxID=38286 RepID=A0A9X8R514_9CORY|nr:hypothetical protein [Corynebacterium afermentans]WJY57758.1 hypothetical protein CAFEA_10980 [Corynebacterium afermentans subsp. afermentans]SIQ40534.1 hypothetical protein SAMN05421802_11360 [Corynebacterium afermentans]